MLLYVLAAGACTWSGLRPGRTLVPGDVLAYDPPYNQILVGGAVHNSIVSDSTFQFFPWMSFLGDQLRHGHVPQWNPYLLAGVRVTPSGFVSPYYPGFWLLGVMSTFDAYDVFVLVHLVIAAAGIRWWCRELGVRQGTAFVMGLAALGSGLWVHWSLHLVHLVGMVWTPSALAACHRLLSRPTPVAVAVFAAVFGVWWLGANPQYAYYGTLVVLTYGVALLLRRWSQERVLPLRASGAWAASLVLGGGIAAAVLVPTASASADVLRSGEPEASLVASHLAAGSLMRALVPDAVGNAVDQVQIGAAGAGFPLDTPSVGVVVVVLFLTGVVSLLAARRVWPLVLVVGAVVVMLLSFTSWPSHLLYGVLPGYDRFRAVSRWLSVLPVLVLPVAGHGLDGLRARNRAAVTAALASVLVALAVVLAWRQVTAGDMAAPTCYISVRAAQAAVLLVLVGLAAAVARRHPRAAAVGLGVLLVAEVAIDTPRWYPSVEKAGAYPVPSVVTVARAEGGRVLRVDANRTLIPALAPDLLLRYGVADAQAVLVIFPPSADRYFRLIDDYGTFAEALNGNPALAAAADVASPLVTALDVRTVLTPPGVQPPGTTPLTGNEGAQGVAAWARPSPGAAVLVRTAGPATEEQMWARVAEPRWDPVGSAAVEGLAAPVTGTGGSVSGGLRGTDHEEWSVHSELGGFLRVSSAWDSGWSAQVDGRSVPVHRADGLFRGVVVPAGSHRVSFSYSNPSERAGRRLSTAALALCLLLLGYGVRAGGPARRVRRRTAPS